MKKSILCIFLFSFFAMPQIVVADLSTELVSLQGRLVFLKSKLKDLAAKLTELKDGLASKIPLIPHLPPPEPLIIPASGPAKDLEYTPEDFKKFIESKKDVEIKLIDDKPKFEGSPIAETYTDQIFNNLIDVIAKDKQVETSTPLMKNIFHILVKRQNELHTCGYYALCNALLFFNTFNSGSNHFVNDLFADKFKEWYKIVLKNNSVNIKNAEVGDLQIPIFNTIKENDEDIKNLWNKHILIYYPYSSKVHSILSLEPSLARRYEHSIKHFHENNFGILIWILGQEQHYYTICIVRNNKIKKMFLCDSLNSQSLYNVEKDTIFRIFNILNNSKNTFESLYTSKIIFELKNDNNFYRTLFRKLQHHKQYIDYFKGLSEDNKKLLVQVLKELIDDNKKPGISYDLIAENDPSSRKFRALHVLKDFFESNSTIDQQINIASFLTDKTYYLHYKDETTAKKSKNSADYCFKTTINPKTYADMPSGYVFDDSIKAGEPKLKSK